VHLDAVPKVSNPTLEPGGGHSILILRASLQERRCKTGDFGYEIEWGVPSSTDSGEIFYSPPEMLSYKRKRDDPYDRDYKADSNAEYLPDVSSNQPSTIWTLPIMDVLHKIEQGFCGTTRHKEYSYERGHVIVSKDGHKSAWYRIGCYEREYSEPLDRKVPRSVIRLCDSEACSEILLDDVLMSSEHRHN
jgi:hypothetical protein